MNSRPDAPQPPPPKALVNPSVQAALKSLVEGYDFALDLQTSPWDFALEMTDLLDCGCTQNALRWLVEKGYAEYTTVRGKGKPGRCLPTQRFPPRSWFVLTEAGAALARGLFAPAQRPGAGKDAAPARAPDRTQLPTWDGVRSELHYRGQLVKRFVQGAGNQRGILDAFQRQGWPTCLEDPLPAPDDPDLDRRERFHDAIKNLNRLHRVPLLRFYGVGGGRAVGWRPFEEASPKLPQIFP